MLSNDIIYQSKNKEIQKENSYKHISLIKLLLNLKIPGHPIKGWPRNRYIINILKITKRYYLIVSLI